MDCDTNIHPDRFGEISTDGGRRHWRHIVTICIVSVIAASALIALGAWVLDRLGEVLSRNGL